MVFIFYEHFPHLAKVVSTPEETSRTSRKLVEQLLDHNVLYPYSVWMVSSTRWSGETVMFHTHTPLGQ